MQPLPLAYFLPSNFFHLDNEASMSRGFISVCSQLWVSSRGTLVSAAL